MGFIYGENRNQMHLYPVTLEELVDENNPVRVIDAFVDHLTLDKLEIQRATPANTGRPPYDPKDLLKLYIYGYFNRIRSSRRLMIECGRNIELIYLLNRLTPDFRTISDFRKNNAKAIKHVFKAFVKVCIDLKLYERELIAGETQILTTDPQARMMRTKDGFACCYNVQTAVDQTSHLIAEYEVTNSCNDSNCLTTFAQKSKEILQVETIHVGADKGYDDKDEIEQCIFNGIIPHVGFKNDKTERLIIMDYEEATITKEDRASTKPQDIERCLKAGVLPTFYEHTIMSIEVQEQNQVSCFVRNLNDTVTCPMGCILTRVRTHKGGSASYQNRLACQQCPNRCTSRKDYKVVKFGPSTRYVPVLMYGTALRQLQEYPTSETPYNAFSLLERRTKKKVVLHIRDDIPTQKLRLCLSEHPFGTVKWYHGAHYLLCKGIEKATGELGLSFLAYNLRRAINMVGTKKLVAAMRA